MRRKTRSSESAFAIIIVVFVIALASILVINLAYSTTLGSRINAMSVQGFQAEYILKSALNFSRRLLMAPAPQPTKDNPSPRDPWEMFKNGMPIPAEFLGISEQNLKVELEIRPEDAKIRVDQLADPANAQRWGQVLYNLFKELGFADDDEADQSGQFKGRSFKPDDLVGILIDYQDPNQDSYTGASFARGIESQLKDDIFTNDRIRDIDELKNIPGFTPNRLKKLMPYISVQGKYKVNINVAPRLILKALNEDLDDQTVDKIIEARNSAPFTRQGDWTTRFRDIVGDNTYNQIFNMIDVESYRYQVLAKVDFGGTSRYFLRAVVNKDDPNSPDKMPKIVSIELF